MGLIRKKQPSTAMTAITGYVYANRRLVRGVAPDPVTAGDAPRYLYWETPDASGDSGWRIFTGDETQADADDAANFQINAIETLLMAHPQLAQVLRPGIRGAWEWSDQDAEYVQITD